MIIVYLLIVHFVADFLLQSREMGVNKSSNWKYLGQHISIIALAFLPFGWKFALANALVHAVIDKFIWNLYKLSAHLRIKSNVEVMKSWWVGIQEEPPGPSTIQDYQRSCYQVEVQNWKYWEDHWFYSSIGFDQLLHGITLVLLGELML